MQERSQVQQTRKNFYTNIIALIVNVAIGVVYTPFLVKKLGLAAYGILPLALIINQYISVATGTLTSSFTRFYSIELQRKNFHEASKVLSTSILVSLVILLSISPFLVYIIIDINSFFQIPHIYITAARFLFIFTLISFGVALFSSILNVTLYAINRLDLITQLNNLRQILKFAFVIALFELIDVDIYYVGVANLSTEIIIFILSWLYFLRYRPHDVTIKFRLYDKAILMPILGMSIWVLIHQIGDTFIYRTDNIVVNHFWGSVESGALGAISELASYIRIVVGVIGSLFGPLILLAYSEERHDDVQRMTLQQSLIVGTFTAIIAGVVAGLSSSILSIWIEQDFSKYSLWLALKVIVVPFYAAGGVLAFVYRAWNKVKLPAMLTLIIGALDLAVILLIPHLKPEASSIKLLLMVSALFSIAQCYVINVYCVHKIYMGNGYSLTKNAFKITAVFILSYIVSSLIESVFNVSNLGTLMIVSVSAGIAMLLVTLFIFLSRDDRIIIKSIVIK